MQNIVTDLVADDFKESERKQLRVVSHAGYSSGCCAAQLGFMQLPLRPG